MKRFILFVLAAITSYPCFSMDTGDLRAELSGLGVSGSALIIPAVPEAAARRDPGVKDRGLSLREEAMADPDRFIDEHTPEEVEEAFGLRFFRYLITDPGRIQNAAVHITVDLTSQRLRVRSAELTGEFKISSGLLPGHGTPGSGKCFAPDAMEPMHYSSLYNNAPMANTIFFNGNIAVHATGAEALLGRPASHGCIRLSKADSKTVYDLVRANGKNNAVICVEGITPGKPAK